MPVAGLGHYGLMMWGLLKWQLTVAVEKCAWMDGGLRRDWNVYEEGMTWSHPSIVEDGHSSPKGLQRELPALCCIWRRDLW